MTAYSTLFLFKRSPFEQVPGALSTHSQKLNSFLSSLFQDFSRKLSEPKEHNSIKLKVTPSIVKQIPTITPNLNKIKFAEISITTPNSTKPNTELDKITITAVIGNDLKFIILPTASERAYNINFNGEEAKLRTKALELIAKALFETSGCEIGVTTNVNDVPVDSMKEAITSLLPYSTFSLIRSGLMPLELRSELRETVHNLKEEDDYTEIEVTDHPFSGWSYTSKEDGGRATLEAYQDAIGRALHNKAIN